MKQKVNKRKVGRPPRATVDMAPPRWGIEDDGSLTSEYATARLNCDRLVEELELSPQEVDEFMKNGRDNEDW